MGINCFDRDKGLYIFAFSTAFVLISKQFFVKIIATCLAFSVFNMVAIYYISFFVAQLLYWHVLGYFMIKLGKLARGPMMFW